MTSPDLLSQPPPGAAAMQFHRSLQAIRVPFLDFLFPTPSSPPCFCLPSFFLSPGPFSPYISPLHSPRSLCLSSIMSVHVDPPELDFKRASFPVYEIHLSTSD